MKYCPRCSDEIKEIELVKEEVVIGDKVVGYAYVCEQCGYVDDGSEEVEFDEVR